MRVSLTMILQILTNSVTTTNDDDGSSVTDVASGRYRYGVTKQLNRQVLLITKPDYLPQTTVSLICLPVGFDKLQNKNKTPKPLRF